MFLVEMPGAVSFWHKRAGVRNIWLPIVHRDTVPVDHSEARSNAAVVSLPEQVLHVDRSLPPALVDEADREDLGSVAVSVDVQLGLKCVLVHQSYVSLVQDGVLGLQV